MAHSPSSATRCGFFGPLGVFLPEMIWVGGISLNLRGFQILERLWIGGESLAFAGCAGGDNLGFGIHGITFSVVPVNLGSV